MLILLLFPQKKARIVLRLGGENPRNDIGRATTSGLSSAGAKMHTTKGCGLT